MRIEFTTASRKHRIGRAHIRYVMATQQPQEVTTHRGERGWRYVGADDWGLELEVIAVELDGGDLLVIHAMPAAMVREMTMPKRTPPKATTKTPIGPDVDLAKEVRRDTQGRRVTDDYVERLLGASRKPGRPSLAEEGPSPSIAFRVPAALRTRAEEVAASEGKTVSQLAREALEARLEAS